jgi:hypothetical protein
LAKQEGWDGRLPPAHFLAISEGSDDGSFGGLDLRLVRYGHDAGLYWPTRTAEVDFRAQGAADP